MFSQLTVLDHHLFSVLMAWSLLCGQLGQLCLYLQPVLASRPLPSVVVTYPPPQNVDHVRNSQTFQVSVNDQPLYVEEYRNVSYAHFSFAGTAEIEVTLPDSAEHFTVSPVSYQIQPQSSGKTMRFSLTLPRNLIIHQNAGVQQDVLDSAVLYIFADPLENPLPQDAVLVNVLENQIDGSGQTDVTAAVQQLINEAAEQSIVYFPPGTYRITSLRMKSNVSLYLAGGARLQVADSPAGFQEPALHFNSVENVKVFGRGVVDGNGVNLRYLPTETDDRRSTLYSWRSDNCAVEGIIIQNPSMFNAWITNSENWSIYGVKAIDYANEDLAQWAGDDGIDTGGSRNIHIDNVFVASGDSPISVKGGVRWPQSDHILVSNSVLFNYAYGGSLGSSDLNGNHISSVTWENIDIVSALYGLTLSSADGPGSISDFLYKNIRYETIRGSLFWVRAHAGPIERIRYAQVSAPDWGKNGQGGEFGNQFSVQGEASSLDTVQLDGVEVAGSLVTSANYSESLMVSEQATNLTFANSEPTVVKVMATELYVHEGTTAGGFTIQRSGNVEQALAIPVAIQSTAQNGLDFTQIPATITIPIGVASVQVKVAAKLDDDAEEPLETVMMSLQASHGAAYMLDPQYHAVVNIINTRPGPAD